MRILFITQLLPRSLDAGPKIRAHFVLKYLAQAGHEVTLLSFVRPTDRQEDIEWLRKICRSVEPVGLKRSLHANVAKGIASLFSKTPFLVLRDQIPQMRQRIDRITGQRSFDAIHVDQLWMAPYGTESSGPRLRVLDQHNAVFLIPRRMAQQESNPAIRLLLQVEASKLEAFERATCEQFGRVVWVTDEDRSAVGSGSGRNGTHDTVIPIATDPGRMLPVSRSSPFRVTFLGGLNWPPNSEAVRWFASRVWPRVAREEPRAVLTVIGRQPPKDLTNLARDPRIEVAGYVSDVASYVAETAVFVVPIRSGAGMRVKILDAWCWGLPIVSTSVGAEGIRTADGENLLIADGEESFARAVIGVLQDRLLAGRLSDNGRATVEAHYDWRKTYQAWDQIYN